MDDLDPVVIAYREPIERQDLLPVIVPDLPQRRDLPRKRRLIRTGRRDLEIGNLVPLPCHEVHFRRPDLSDADQKAPPFQLEIDDIFKGKPEIVIALRKQVPSQPEITNACTNAST